MGEEVELKLALTPAARRALLRHPLLAQATALAPPRRLVSTYYDTPDLALRLHGVALRLRRQGREWVQTVKLAGRAAAGLSARPEWEVPSDGRRFDFSGIDDPACRKRLERALGRLAPVFETRFTRRVWRFVCGPDCAVLLMLDQGRVVAGERSLPISEVELELERGAQQALFDLALRLAADIPVRPERLSKAQRGFQLGTDVVSTPRRAEPSPVARGQTIQEAWSAIALACLTQLQANEVGARAGTDPEYLHQMRVALRRLRSAVRAFSPLLAADANSRAKAGMIRLGQALSEARDWDVLSRELLAPVCQAFPEDERLRALLRVVDERRQAARACLRRFLDSAEYGRLLLELLEWATSPLAAEGSAEIGGFADARLAVIRKQAMKRMLEARSREIEVLHRLRIAAKRWRYALEFFAPLYPSKPVDRTLQAIVALQTQLGELNDIASAQRLLGTLAKRDQGLREAVALCEGWCGRRRTRILDRLTRRMDRLPAGR